MPRVEQGPAEPEGQVHVAEIPDFRPLSRGHAISLSQNILSKTGPKTRRPTGLAAGADHGARGG